MPRRLRFILGGGLALAVAGATATAEATTQSLPNASPMTLQASDFTSAKLAGQQAQNGQGIAGYQRVYSNAKVGGRVIPGVFSVALVMPDLEGAQQTLGPIEAVIVKETAKGFAKGFEKRNSIVTVTVKTGARQPVQVGDRAALVPVTVTLTPKKLPKSIKKLSKPARKLLGFTTKQIYLDYAFVRVDSAIGVVAGIDTRVGGLRNAVVTLAGDAAAHMKVGLAPSAITTPTITAPATLSPGAILATASSAWSGSGTGESVTYAWERCDPTGANCVAIPGAVTASYALAQADVGSTIRAEVIYANVDGSATSPASTQTVVVGS